MRLPNSAHTQRPWRIHELTADFRLEDVWSLPTPGGPEDFPRLVKAIASGDPAQSSSGAARAVWAIRWKIGRLLGWDRPDAGLGARVPTLRDRLPADLREGASGPDFDGLPFVSLYLLEDEWAAEIANRTVHGVMHLGWVSDGSGGAREAERAARDRLHGCDQTVPAPDRLSAHDTPDRARLACTDARRRRRAASGLKVSTTFGPQARRGSARLLVGQVLLVGFSVHRGGRLLLWSRIADDARGRVIVAVGGVLDQLLLGELEPL
jgi:Protein of unknown function (DUF2867)